MAIQGPLNGITVVDLGQVLSAPFATKMLVDLGARVIKVEHPAVWKGNKEKDPKKTLRGMLPPYYFASVAYGKESIALDLKKQTDRTTFEKLLGKADVLVANYRGGVMKKLGYDWEKVHARWPQLIMCTVSGFGEAGGQISQYSDIPYNRLPSYNHIAEAMSGIMSITGHEGTPPSGHGPNTADVYAGTVAVVGIQGALIQRMKDGKGRYVDVSMLDANYSLMSHIIARHQSYEFAPDGTVREGRGITPTRTGAWWYLNSVFDVFQCKDGKWFMLIAFAGKDFRNVCKVVGRPEWTEDPRYKDHDSRLRNYKTALQPELRSIFKSQVRSEWLGKIQPLGVPCGPVNSIEDVLQDPQLHARNMVGTVKDTMTGMEFTVPGNAVKISGFPDSKFRGTVHAHDEDGPRIRSNL